MSGYVNVPKNRTPKSRVYASLRGVDFSSEPSEVSLSRSPDALNVYKDYSSALGQAIQTRPGFKKAGSAEGKIYGIHIFGNDVLIHHKNRIGKASGSVNEPGIVVDYSFVMNEKRSVSFVFAGSMYILDGKNFLMYKDGSLKSAASEAFVPTTRVGAAPDGGGGEYYQDVNMLSPYRKNSFMGDGQSKKFLLDATQLDEETPRVWIDGVEKTSGFTYSAQSGVVEFEKAPEKSESDNVTVKFKKTTQGHLDKICKCTLACVFDNRVFLSGNPEFKGIVLHSELDNAAYFSEESEYDAGGDNVGVKALIASDNTLTVIKEDRGQSEKVFCLSPALDYEEGKVYPMSSGGVNLGALGEGTLFFDDVVYLSRRGLEGVSQNSGKCSLKHRSSLADAALVNEGGYENAVMGCWKNYLLIMVGEKMYLADSRQKFSSGGSFEYEWYLWDSLGTYDESGVFGEACALAAEGDLLMFGCENGDICAFEGTNDNGKAINAYWCTPQDVFGSISRVKTVSKKGGVAVIKRIQNGLLKVAASTDKQSFCDVCRAVTEGFSFKRVKFAEMNFGTGSRGSVCFKVKRRNIWQMQLKFYSDEKDKPFGLFEATLEYKTGKYFK